MSVLTRPMTYDDLQHTPDDGNRYELIGGEVFVSPAPVSMHQLLSGELFHLLYEHVMANHLGRVLYAPVDVKFTLHSAVQPDLLFIRQDRLDIIRLRGPIEGPPDLVVEIFSPSNERMDRVRKAALYAEFGVPEYWLVDPEERTVEILTLDAGTWSPVTPDGEGRITSVVLPGITVDPVALFADLDVL